MTLGTDRLSPIPGQHDPVLYLILVLFHHAEEIIDSLKQGITIPQKFLLRLGKLIVRTMYRETRCLGHAYQSLFPLAHFLTFPADHGIVVHRKGFIGYHQIFIDTDDPPEALAYGTSADRTVEIEHQIIRFFKCHTIGLETIGKSMRLDTVVGIKTQ